jgi:hypothetical protein
VAGFISLDFGVTGRSGASIYRNMYIFPTAIVFLGTNAVSESGGEGYLYGQGQKDKQRFSLPCIKYGAGSEMFGRHVNTLGYVFAHPDTLTLKGTREHKQS